MGEYLCSENFTASVSQALSAELLEPAGNLFRGVSRREDESNTSMYIGLLLEAFFSLFYLECL